MKTGASICIMFGILLTGCVGSSTKRPEISVSPKSKVSMPDFTGVYNDRSESTKGEQRSLASALGIYHRTPAPDSVTITVSSTGDLLADAKQGGIILGHGPIKSDGPLKGGRLTLNQGRADSGGFFSSGKERFSSTLYMTKDGNIALESSSTFTGTFLVFPAYGQQTSVYIWKRKQNEN